MVIEYITEVIASKKEIKNPWGFARSITNVKEMDNLVFEAIKWKGLL